MVTGCSKRQAKDGFSCSRSYFDHKQHWEPYPHTDAPEYTPHAPHPCTSTTACPWSVLGSWGILGCMRGREAACCPKTRRRYSSGFVYRGRCNGGCSRRWRISLLGPRYKPPRKRVLLLLFVLISVIVVVCIQIVFDNLSSYSYFSY